MDTIQNTGCQDDVNDRVHLFIVHSMITYAMAAAVIKHRGIKPENCVLCAYRKFIVPADCNPAIAVYNLPMEYAWVQTFAGRKQNREIRYIDNFITTATKDRPFELYVTHTLAPFLNLFISHKKRMRYNIIEEGCSRFCTRIFDPDEISCRRVQRICDDYLGDNPRFRVANRCWLDTEGERFGSLFAIYPDSYTAGKNVVVVPDVFQKVEDSPYDDAEAFLVIDMIVQYRERISVDLYIKALDYVICEHFIPRGYRKVYYKSRKFEECDDLGTGLESLVTKYASVLVMESLPDDCFYENVVYTHNVPVYYIMSSVGFFAQAMGRETHTLVDVCGSFDVEVHNEFYLAERNVMAKKAGVLKLPCNDVFTNRLYSVQHALGSLRNELKNA